MSFKKVKKSNNKTQTESRTRRHALTHMHINLPATNLKHQAIWQVRLFQLIFFIIGKQINRDVYRFDTNVTIVKQYCIHKTIL